MVGSNLCFYNPKHVVTIHWWEVSVGKMIQDWWHIIDHV